MKSRDDFDYFLTQFYHELLKACIFADQSGWLFSSGRVLWLALLEGWRFPREESPLPEAVHVGQCPCQVMQSVCQLSTPHGPYILLHSESKSGLSPTYIMVTTATKARFKETTSSLSRAGVSLQYNWLKIDQLSGWLMKGSQETAWITCFILPRTFESQVFFHTCRGPCMYTPHMGIKHLLFAHNRQEHRK